MLPPNRAEIECCAEAGHAANLAFLNRLGIKEPSWADAYMPHKEWVRSAVVGVLQFDWNAKQVHQSWLARKIGQQWTYGATKDRAKKTHPAMLEWDDPKFPLEEQVKNEMFVQIVRAVFSAQRAVPS